MDSTATFAAAFAALYAAHSFGDHWVQTHTQACGKGAPTRAGRLACARHVATLASTKLLALGLVMLVTGLRPDGLWLVVGLLIDAVSHYWADRAAKHPNGTRRVTLAALAERLGKGDFYRMGSPRMGHGDQPHLGTGAYALDQSWHVAWLFVAALFIAA